METASPSVSLASDFSSTSPQAESPAAEHLIVLVDRPDDWKPTDVGDVPPGVELVQLFGDGCTAAFTRLFNEREMQISSERWAIRLSNSLALVFRHPADWKPAAATDLPPNVEVHKQPTAEFAAIFAENFNRLEMATESSGHWAITSTPDEGSRVEGDNFDIIDEAGDDDDREGRDEFDLMFPGLPVTVFGTDGSESTEYICDPRSAYARSRSRHEGVAAVKNGDDSAKFARLENASPLESSTVVENSTAAPESCMAHFVVLDYGDRESIVYVDIEKPRSDLYAKGYNEHGPESVRAVVRSIDVRSLGVIRKGLSSAIVRRIDLPASDSGLMRLAAMGSVPQK